MGEGLSLTQGFPEGEPVSGYVGESDTAVYDRHGWFVATFAKGANFFTPDYSGLVRIGPD
jgi:hypothetical protein